MWDLGMLNGAGSCKLMLCTLDVASEQGSASYSC